MKRIFSLILALMAVQMMWAAKIPVTNTSDDEDEEGSLRWACKNATAEDTIVFKFSTKGDKTIHISSPLSTTASIDGSTWADSIIIEGTNKKANSNDDGFQGVGAFVKNIIVQNCYAGFHVLTSTAKSNAFYDCIASNCRIGFYCENSSDVSIIRCKSLNNDNYGITSGSRVLDAIEDCDIIGNKKAGIYGQAKNITGCRIYNNDVGIDVVYNSDLIDDCVISGNTTYGIHVSGKVKKISNNVIGLTEDQKDVYSNDNGIYIQGSGVDILSGNVISGNLKDGINSSLKGSDIGVFMGNYIGTNKYFVSDPKFGNGANGYYPSSSSSYPKFSRNYFGNNAENGIKGSFSGTISFEDCYFGITPDGDPMPNGIDGLNVGSSNMTFKNCHVGYNEGSGINVTRGTVTVNGGEFIGNKEMGLSLLSGNPNFTVEDAIFDSNGNSAISFDNKGYLTSSLISNTKFLRTNKAYPAYSTTNPYPVPEFTSCKMTEKTIEIVGKVDTEEEVKIELFYTSQGEQTAEKLVYSSTETDGTFSISLDRSEFAGKSIIGFTATATYGGKYTSPLSDVVYPELGKVDLTRTEFYVKVKGDGDGSTWEKAMSPKAFAYTLPQVKDGTTFYVAKGVYEPDPEYSKQSDDDVCFSTSAVNVSIIGGFPADIMTDTPSDPKRYETIFRSTEKAERCFMSYSTNFYGVVFESPISVNFPGEKTVTFEKCTFRKIDAANNGDYKCVVRHYQTPKSVIEFKECQFTNNKSTLLQGYQAPTNVGVDKYYNCSFVGNEADVLFGFPRLGSGYGDFYEFVNCTFSKNKANWFFSFYGGLRLYNNSFFNNEADVFLYDKSGDTDEISTIVGNVFLKNDFTSVLDGGQRTTASNYFDLVEHNLFQPEISEFTSWPDNIKLSETEELEKNLYTTYSSGEIYISNYGGFTETAKLKVDKLSNGTSIRFPRLENVLTDQRGEPRLIETCMGAYEIGCSKDTTSVSDSIYVGGKVLGMTYSEVGVYENVLEKLKVAYDCDSVVRHTVVVKPDPKVNEYTVTNTNDDGEGSLRKAIDYANLSESETFNIKFDFKEAGPYVIKIKSPLNIRRDNLTIDGSTVSDSIIIDGGDKEYHGIYVGCSMGGVIKSICVRNCERGFDFFASEFVLENCDATENMIGMRFASCRGVVDKCLMSGNERYGVYLYNASVGGTDTRCFRTSNIERVIVQNSIIGLTRDLKKKYPNGVGVYPGGDSDTIINNVISGNREDGVLVDQTSRVALLSNYIGVNRRGQNFGNGGNGIKLNTNGNNVGSLRIGGEDLSDGNIIGCNGEYGISTSSETGFLGVGANYIGITPDGGSIGNKKGGILAGSLYMENSVICCNGGDGVMSFERAIVKNCVIGDKRYASRGNDGYGIHVLSRDLTAYNNSIWNNSLGGIYYEGYEGYPQTNIDASQNLFGGEQPFAIESKYETLNIPSIKKVNKEGKTYIVSGHVDFIDGTPLNSNQYYSVDSSKIGIELFKNLGEKETAHSYIGYTETDENGDWSFEIDKSVLDENPLCLAATAIHFVLGPPGQYVDHQIYKYTSGLSEPFCCEECIACPEDTTMVTDTIVVGSKFADGKVYNKVGIYADILTKHISKLDCDSVVNHTLFVVPDPKIKEYYVKTSKKGKGDGSSWDDAIDPKTFAFVFENLKTEGVTFYIAEGKYYAVYDGWGKETNNKNAHWSSKHGANIYGGYDSLSTGNATTTKPDPALYRTIMTGDFKNDDNVKLDGDCGYTFENFSDNMNSSMISMEVHGDVHISGVELTGMTFSHGTSPALIRLIAKSGTEYSATIDHCKLSVADKGIEANYIRNLIVDHCEVDYVKNSAVYSNGDCKVTNSTFNHTAGINYDGNNSNLVVENSTFVKNRSDIQLYIYGTELSASAQINNNTFISCDGGSYFSIYDNVSATVSGNIFAGSEINIYKRDGEAKQQTFANNVIACKTFELGESGVEKDNIKVADVTALYKILEGTYSESDGIFTPALTYKGAETRTVALLEETLSDGTPIRFPRLKNVLTDQRGVSRLEKTCMGAYEIGCGSDTTFSTDTINVGTKIYGQTFTKVGVHDSIFETLQTANGCDSVVMHRVVVKPDPKTFNYYVKTKRWGKGDGSTWDDAMDGTDFATYLPLAPEGTTFYVAEGTYSPFVKNGRQFLVNNSVTIKGGYPNGIKKGDLEDPSLQNKTIFNGEIIENDQKEKLYLFILTKENIKFRIEHSYLQSSKYSILSSDPNDIIVLDCYLSSSDYGVFANASSDITVANTIFADNKISIRSNISGKYNGVIKIKDSEFIEDNDNTQSFVLAGDSLFMYNVTFSKSNVDNIPLMFNKYIELKKCNFIDIEQKSSIILSNADSASVDSCVFRGCKGNGLLSESKSIQVSNSIFESNEVYDVFFATVDCDAYLYRNTFSNNITSSSVVHSAKKVTMCNNTVTGNTAKNVLLLENKQSILNNNTIVGNTSSYSIKCNDIIFGGNILLANGDGSVFNAFETSQFIDNIMPPAVWGDRLFDFTGNLIIEDTDTQYEVASEIFEGEQTKEGFVPTLKDNGGFTPTVALKSDKLSDGKSIRFPRLENVLTDQRGVSRFDETCMGAYEMRCSTVETVLKDTVMVGDSYTFIDKNLDDVCQKVGSYHFTETLKSVEGCDSIVKLSLAVRPQKNENGYYVKENGTGDGSDWNNAMSPKDFAEYLPLVYDGETFHIAAGTYKSTYVDPELGRMYNINSSVTLIGGYPDTVTSTSTSSMPDVYVTKLTADVKGNDYTYYYPNSLDYTPYSNVKDNDSILIRVNGAKTLNLFGMTLSGVNSCDRGAVDLADGASLVMDRCFVQDNVASGVYGKGVDVKVTNSVFTHNYSNNGAAFNLVDSKLNVQSTAVYENRAKVEECESGYSMGGVANLENTEATFENSTLSNNAADIGSVFSVKSSKLDLTNNTIVGNQIIPESKHKGSVIGSLDDKSSVSLFGNIVIGNQNGEFDGVVNVASSDYNVFSYKTDMSYGSHDMVMNDPKEVQMLLDGDFAFESETVFIPNIQYNGGYTPTVAVIQSAFDGGKILNIPLDDRKVTYDQRGFVRKDSSCIGAFEFPTFMGYYVKKQAHGDGSGRDWENSMNDTTFAKYFPIVPTSASFHVAEGVYTPMFDSYGKLTESKSRCYSTSRLVNIYGGYPDSAQTGCVADPTKYKTILSVDFNGDDKYVESADEYSCIDALNTSDNGYSILGIVSKVPGWIEIKGIDFRGQRCVPRASSSAVQVSSGNIGGVNIRIEKCSFVGNYTAIYSGCDSTIIEECLFDSLDYSGLSVSSFSSSENNYLFVDKSTFANSLYHLSPYSFKGEMRVQNSTFANTLYGVYTPSGYAVTPENTKVELYNNSFFSGKKEKNGLLIYDFVPVELKGNIISSKKLDVKPDPNGKYESNVIVSDYNVYTTETDALKLGENDTIVPQSSIGEIVNGVVENDIFEATLDNQGIYVKMLPSLVNVNFSDGGGIKKMQEKVTPVTDDQRGVVRPSTDYCIGSIEADCEFSGSKMNLNTEKTVVCRGDSVELTISGLTLLEKNSYKYKWESDDPGAIFSNSSSYDSKIYLKGQNENVEAKLTITNVCGNDTVLSTLIKVNGTGEVPFTGIDESGTICLNVAEPIELSTEVEGAKFKGECIVNGHFFDPTLAKADSTVIRCYIVDEVSGCDIYTEKIVHIQSKDETANPVLNKLRFVNQSCGSKPNGMIMFEISDVTENLTYRVDGPDFPANKKETKEEKENGVLWVTIDSINAGDYQVSITDGCYDYAMESFTVEDKYSIKELDAKINNINCFGENDGEVILKYEINKDIKNFELVLKNIDNEENAVLDLVNDSLHISQMSEGVHELIFQSTSNVCPDIYKREFSISGPSTYFKISELNVEGVGCDANITPVVTDPTNDLVFNWTSMVSYKETTTTLEESTLKNSGAGKTMCVAYSEKCDRSDTAYVDVPSSSDAVDNLTITPYAIDESCMGANNGRIKCMVDSVNNKRVAVTVVVEALSNGVKTLNTYNREDNVIRFESLEPGDYRVTAYQGSPECVEAPSDFDTTLTIRPMLNSLAFHSLDKVVDAVCLSNLDASAQLTAIGVPSGLNMQVLKDGEIVKTYKYAYRLSDTAVYVADKLVSGDYLARIVNGCSDTTEQKFTIGGTQPFEVSVDSTNSVFSYDCFDTESEKGSVKIICTGGSDSMLVSLNLYDRKNPSVSSEISTKKLYKKDMPYSVSYTDLLSGKYFVRLQTLLPDCDDKQDLEFAIKGNDFITLDSLVVEGVGCDATIEPYASGDETGYTFYWNNSISHKERTSTGTLLNAGAGTFSCVAVSNRCQAYSDTLFVDVPAVSDPIDFNVTLTSGNESCYGANNGVIRCVVDSVNGERVPVTIVAESIDADTLIQASYNNVNNNDNVIRLWYLKPGEYHVTAYQGSPECVEAPSDFDTIVVIKPMLNKLKFLSVDSIKDAICLSDSDAHAYVTAIGVSGGQLIQSLYPNGHIEEFGYFKRNEDTASFHIKKLLSGEFTARIINTCKDTVLQKFTVGGTKPYVVDVDSSKSVLKVKCPYDTTGVIVAKFSGGYDSCRYAFYKLNSTKTAIVATLKENSILTKDSEQTVKVTGLGKGQYKIVLATTVPGCADHKSFYIEIKGPADVVDKKDVLDISCSSFNDGSISFKPYRLGVSSTQYVIHRDSALIKEHYDAYLLFKAVQTEVVNGHGDKVNGYIYEPVYFNGDENHQIVVRINKAFNRNEFYYREDNSIVKIQNIDELNASAPRLYQNDFVDSSFKWYKKSDKGWSQLSILMPDSSDVDEAWYFRTKDGKADTIKLEPVWGCSHLEEFWEDHLGDYLEPDAITLANLAPAWYKVVYNDSVGCVYSDSFEIKKPQRPLMFDSVRFLSNLAKCDPTKRYITAYVDGGWGEYNYSFAREGQVYTKNNSRYDGYLGGNYIKFDTTKLKGICRSEFLLPGNYTVTVVDKKGCFVKYNGGAKIAVASEFTATVDTVNVLCPGGDDAPVIVKIYDKEYNGPYDIYEYDSDCLTNTCDTCNRDTITLRKEKTGKEVEMNFGDGTHGLFIYRAAEGQNCGTYVPAVVTDTIPPMRIQLEAKRNVSCAAQPEHLTKDGMIKLSLLGGTQPYTLFRDKELFSDEHIEDYKEFRDSVIKNEKGEVIKTVKIINLENLEAGRYYFTIKDYNKCIRHMGEDNNDTVVVLKSPDPISTLIAASSICPKEGEDLGEGVVFAETSSSGAVFAKYVEGGTEPYEYVVDGFPADNVNDPYIYVSGDESSKFHYTITDALGCTYDTTVMFGQDKIEVKRIDFMASKYNKNGDVIALIDFCGPEDYFDSVRYEISGVNAKKFEILDRRMYIYDIQGGNKTAKEALLKLTDTKSVPDAFFAQNFELIDKYSLLGKHINFIKLNDTLSSKGNMDVWRQCELTMYAYFKGCRYTLNQNGLGVIKSDIVISGDDFDWYEGGVKSNNDILDISLSPNPYTPASGDVLSVDVTFGAKVDYKIYIYSMNGNLSYEFEGHASDLKESRVKGEYLVSKTITESALDLSKSQAFVVLVQTEHDSDAKLLLVNGK
ncbi:MAG: right-handed parallel beta-helix repeat-containing protein [Paludibacteraceae bacterium]|nr:right-handed parallel beta-helix repeat-containing protein [Paludibacteraceae bacterium]